MQKMWQQINKTVHKNKNKNCVTCIKTEKGIISDPFAIGNKINEFYTSVASKLVSKIKTVFSSQISGRKTTRFNVLATHKYDRN